MDIEALAKKYGTDAKLEDTSSLRGIDIEKLADKYSAMPEVSIGKTEVPEPAKAQNAIVQGTGKGLSDIGEFVGNNVIGPIDKALLVGGKERQERFAEIIRQKNKQYEEEFGNNPVAQVGRTVGQVIGTAPLVPSRLLNATDAVLGAAPFVSATGAKIAAPLGNRLAASIAKGGIGGTAFGAATADADKKPMLENASTGLIMGAVGAPIISGGSALADKTIQSARRLWASVDVRQIANKSGLPTSSVEKVIKHLEDVGLTPQQAQAELDALGSKATLMDLDNALSSGGRSLSTMGVKPAAIMRGRMEVRADTANSDTVQQLEAKLGPRPGFFVEKGKGQGAEVEAIKKQARVTTASDYYAAHSSPDKLPTTGLVSHIDAALENAVGQKSSVLKEIKGYLYKPDGSLKDSVKSLHEVRQGIDDILNKKGDGLSPNAYRQVSGVRDLVDTILKTNPNMAAADAKFAKEMERVDAMVLGHNVITKGMNRDEFAKLFNASTPEIQETIKRGQYAAVRNTLDNSSQGELTAASKIFNKKSVNRANFKTAFGKDADEVLDAVHKDITFRETERRVLHGSDTAQNQAFQQSYGLRDKPPSAFGEATKGIGLDIIGGIAPLASTTQGVRTGIHNRLVKRSENALEGAIEGSADIMSRSGAEARAATDVMTRVKAIQDGLKKPNLISGIRLPVSAAAPAGEETYDFSKKAYGSGKRLFQNVFGK